MIAFLRRFFLTNRSTGQVLIKNTAWLFAGEIVGRLIRFWIVIYAARVLGASEYGVFSYALSIAAFATIFADIGLSALLTRETSRAPELRQKYFNAILLVKLFLIALVAIGTYFIVPLISNVAGVIALIPLIIAMFAFDSLREFGFGIHRSLEKMELEATTKIIMNALITALGFAALWYSTTARSLAVGYAVGAGIGCLLTFWLLRGFLSGLRGGIDWALMWPVLKLSWPIGMLQLLGAITVNINMVLLGWWRSPEELGYFGAAQKVILLLYVIPALLASAVFPAFSRFALGAHDKFRELFEKSVAVCQMLALPLAFGGIAISPQIMSLLFGPDYLPGSLALGILLFTLIIVFPSSIFSNALFAYNRQRIFMWFVIVGVVSNLLLGWLLIPRFGIEGAALATLGSQLITNIFVWRAMRKTNRFRILTYLRRVILVSMLCGLISYVLAGAGMPTLGIIAIAAGFYAILLYLMREPLLLQLRRMVRREEIATTHSVQSE